MAGWSYEVPKPTAVPQRPPQSAQTYPMGTVATGPDGHRWTCEWDEQDHRHMWVMEKED